MAVIALAGHVDHGKSTLVRALTGMEPDRWAEERRRGMTIDLGYAWLDLDGRCVALVDVPGHERFVTSMLAGVGPAPAVMLVVAADEGWSRQTQEHAEGVVAFGITELVLVVTKSDRADPAPAQRDSLVRLGRLGLFPVTAMAVSAVTGAGLPDLRSALSSLAHHQHETDPSGRSGGPDAPTAVPPPPRLWVDRSFTVHGVGTVVTGTMVAGRVSDTDAVWLGQREVQVRGLQTCGEPVVEVHGPARLAISLRGVSTEEVPRGTLVTWRPLQAVTVLDVRVRPLPTVVEPRVSRRRALVLHVGTAAVPCRIHWLSGEFARVTCLRPVGVVAGDRAALRDPGERRVLAGVEVVALDPAPFTRRGDASRRAATLAAEAEHRASVAAIVPTTAFTAAPPTDPAAPTTIRTSVPTSLPTTVPAVDPPVTPAWTACWRGSTRTRSTPRPPTRSAAGAPRPAGSPPPRRQDG